MISYVTVDEVLVYSKSNTSAKVRASITERYITDETYLIVGRFEEIGVDEEGNETFTFIDEFRREFTPTEAGAIYQAYKSQLTTTDFPEQFDELTKLVLLSTLAADANWELDATGWE